MDNLNKEFTLKFTKQELLVIVNNLLVTQDGTPQGRPRLYTPGEGTIVRDVTEKIRPLIEDAKPPEQAPEEGVTVN